VPEVVPSVAAVPVAPKVVLVTVEEVFVVSRLTWERNSKPHGSTHPVSDSTMLLPPVPAVVAVRVNGFAAVPGVTVAFTADTFLKQGALLHSAELFSMAARRFVVVIKWPGPPDPPSSTALAGDGPPGRVVTIE
jgi:hypothetical protein